MNVCVVTCVVMNLLNEFRGERLAWIRQLRPFYFKPVFFSSEDLKLLRFFFSETRNKQGELYFVNFIKNETFKNEM